MQIIKKKVNILYWLFKIQQIEALFFKKTLMFKNK